MSDNIAQEPQENQAFPFIPPTNTIELFTIIEILHPKELMILDTLAHLLEVSNNNIYATRETKALSSGCCENYIKKFEKKYNGILFKRNFRTKQTNLIKCEPWIYEELVFLKRLIKHIGAFQDYKNVLGRHIFFKNLTFKDIYNLSVEKSRGNWVPPKLFITSEKEKPIVHNSNLSMKNTPLMNKKQASSYPLNRPPVTPTLVLTLKESSYQNAIGKKPLKIQKNHVYKTFERYQMLDYISPEKYKYWKKYSESQLIEAINQLCYSMTKNPVKNFESYLQKLLGLKSKRAYI